MSTEVRVPTLGESVTEATVAQWFKQPGDDVALDEMLCELETDKVTVEVPSPAAGTMGDHVAAEGDTVEVDALLAHIEEGDGKPKEEAASDGDDAKEAEEAEADEEGYGDRKEAADEAEEEDRGKEPAEAKGNGEDKEAAEARDDGGDKSGAKGKKKGEAAPSAKKLAEEKGVDLDEVEGSGKGGLIMKEDVQKKIEAPSKPDSKRETPKPDQGRAEKPQDAPEAPEGEPEEREKRVKMTRLRQTIAKRLKDAQNNAAMLTTYNEADMTEVMRLRNEYKELFEKKHGVRLGFMSFFVKACCLALKEIPEVNAELDETEIVYKHYCHVGVAVGTPQGLVVPVIRDADKMGFAAIEKRINELGQKARDGKLSMEEMQNGTFTISNGGVYGSLMSSPILNPPQSGILGMHKIMQRPMVIDGEIQARPMMYLALSYDHRIVDGQGAVTFLVRVKEAIEDPRRLLMDL